MRSFRTPSCLEAAVERALKGRQAKRPLPVRERILAGPLGRTLLFNMVGKKTEQKPKGTIRQRRAF